MFKKNHELLVIRLLLALALFAGVFDVFPTKADAGVVSGWAQSMGGTGTDSGFSIAVDETGNIYTMGKFNGTVDFDPGAGTNNLTSAGDSDIFITKFSNEGQFAWARRIGGTGTDYGRNIALDQNGNIYITGAFRGTVDFDPNAAQNNLTSAGYDDIFISKLDTDGNLIWAKRIGYFASDFGFGIAVDANGNVFTTGIFGLTADFDPGSGVSNLTSTGSFDIFVCKLDTNGDFAWATKMGSTGQDEGFDIAVDEDGAVYTTGYFRGTADFDPGEGESILTSAGDRDIFISALDGADGSFLWAKNIGSTGQDYGSALSTVGNSVYITGSFTGVVDFDPDTGVTNLTSLGGLDIFINRLSTSGDFVWAKSMGGTMDDSSWLTASDSGIYATGQFQGTVDFDPGAGTTNLVSAGSADIFVSRLDDNGDLIWAKSMGGTGYDTGISIAVDGNSIYTTGSFQGVADFDPDSAVSNLTSAGDSDIFISNLENEIIYVNSNATGNNDGTSWADAYTDLQSALSAASSGGEIWVAAGTYKPTAGTDRISTFILVNGVKIYGGFAGTETLRKQRDPSANVTILSGDLNGDDNDNISYDEPTRAENAYNVVTGPVGGSASAVLDGFTITGGNASSDGVNAHTQRGGGLWNGGSPTLENLIITRNSSQQVGGGMYAVTSDSILTDVTFENNSSYGGGALFTDQSDPTLTRVTFTDNTATYGGAVDNHFGSNPTFIDVTFMGNTAGLGGAMSNYQDSSPQISGSTFYDNHAYDVGSNTGRGGGIYNNASSPLIENSTFYGNTADYGGSGVANLDSSPTLTHVTFTGNWDAISNVSSHPILRNSIIWNNVEPVNSSVYTITDDLNSSTTASDSVIQNGYAGGTNIITTDPLLGPLGNYGGNTQTISILPGSSAIDTADDENCPDTDQRGMARPLGNHCDIGAFEIEYYQTLTSIDADSPDPSLIDTLVTISVTASGGPTLPTGTVDVSSSEANCSITLTGGSGSCDLLFDSIGIKSIQASYSGDATHASSVDTEDHIVKDDMTAPTVLSVVRAEGNPTSAIGLDFTVTFSESVTGVNTSAPFDDFTLTTTGITAPSILSVSGSDSTYTVTVNSGTGNGTVRLNVVDDDSIVDAASNPLGGVGTGNGNFTSGESYDVNKSSTLKSKSGEDGWILESAETSNKGGKLNTAATTLNLGDDVANKQYRNILSFDTSALPEGAIITKVSLNLKKAGVAGGGNPITTFKGFMVEIKKGEFGMAALEAADFKTVGDMTFGPFKPALVNGWYSLDLTAGNSWINTDGNTQIRLRFKLDDNNNFVANFLKLYSGNADPANQPQLIIEYSVP